MITDVIIGAIDTMIDLCSDPAQKVGMLSLREMLCDLDVNQWYDLNAEEEKEWLSQYLSCPPKVDQIREKNNVQTDTAGNLIAVDIEWDIEEDKAFLPTEIEIPFEMEDKDEISDYLSDITGFCHKGFKLMDYEEYLFDKRRDKDPVYVAIFNFWGNGYDLLSRLSDELGKRFSKECSVSLVNGDTLCFRGLDGQKISELMEASGYDYNYSYESPEDAWEPESDFENASDLQMNYEFAKYGDWTDFCDEHVMLVREIPEREGGAFECLKVIPHNDDDHTLCMLHEIVFTDDFAFTNSHGEEQLNQLLQGFGYKGLDDYVRDMNGDKDWIYNEDGSVDRHASASWNVNWSHLASFVCESHDHGLKVTPDDAKHTVQRIAQVDIPHDFFFQLAGCEMKQPSLDNQIESASIRASGSHSSEQQPVKTPSFER